MRVLPTKIHGLLDYLTAIFLMMSPWLLGFNENHTAMWVVLLMGAAVILYSVCTDYEWGAFRILSMKSHLTIDLLVGIFLAVSPWLLGFADDVFLPHLIVGLFSMVASLITKKEVSRRGNLGPSTL